MTDPELAAMARAIAETVLGEEDIHHERDQWVEEARAARVALDAHRIATMPEIATNLVYPEEGATLDERRIAIVKGYNLILAQQAEIRRLNAAIEAMTGGDQPEYEIDVIKNL